MSYRFAVMWLKAFRDSPEKVCDLYADDFLFEDLMLGQSITDKADLCRAFAPYANKDITNGIGVHLFRIDEYIGDENRGLIRWSWEAHGAAAFLGVPTNGKVVGTSGHTMHVYQGGKIKRIELKTGGHCNTWTWFRRESRRSDAVPGEWQYGEHRA